MINFFRPETLADALALKEQHENSVWLAGGSHINSGANTEHYETLVSLENLGLNTISSDDRTCEIGATVTLQEIIDCPVVHADIQAAMGLIYSRNLRNQTTIGGEIAQANPRNPVLAALIAACAQVVLADERVMPVEQYLADDHKELILKVAIPCNLKALKMHRIGNTVAAEPTLAAAVCQLNDGSWGLALAGVEDQLIRLHDVEKTLHGCQPADFDKDAFAKAVSEAVTPVSDFRASAEYRRQVSGVVTARLVHELMSA